MVQGLIGNLRLFVSWGLCGKKGFKDYCRLGKICGGNETYPSIFFKKHPFTFFVGGMTSLMDFIVTCIFHDP